MITLEKLAGYEPEFDVLDKVAEAMDYLEEFDIDPIGGLTAIYNVDEDGYALDERVASELSMLDDYQLEALENVAAYLADEDPSEVAALALELERVAAEKKEKPKETWFTRARKTTGEYWNAYKDLMAGKEGLSRWKVWGTRGATGLAAAGLGYGGYRAYKHYSK